MANQTDARRPATIAGRRRRPPTRDDVATTTRDVANEVAERASAVAARLPEAAATTRSAVEEAARRMEAGSDEALAVGASLSVGLAIGLLIGGANRLLVVARADPGDGDGLHAARPLRAAGARRRAATARDELTPSRRLTRRPPAPGTRTRPRPVARPRFFMPGTRRCSVSSVLDARNARRRGLRASARIGVGDAPSQASPRGELSMSSAGRVTSPRTDTRRTVRDARFGLSWAAARHYNGIAVWPDRTLGIGRECRRAPGPGPEARGYVNGLPDPQWSGAHGRVCAAGPCRRRHADGDGVAAVCRRNARARGCGAERAPGRPPRSAHHLAAEDLQDGRARGRGPRCRSAAPAAATGPACGPIEHRLQRRAALGAVLAGRR